MMPNIAVASITLSIILQNVNAFSPNTTPYRYAPRLKGGASGTELHQSSPTMPVASKSSTKQSKKSKSASAFAKKTKSKVSISKQNEPTAPTKRDNESTVQTIRKRKEITTTSSKYRPLKDLQLGTKVSGTVVDVCDFGAFVNIGYATLGSRPGTALLHISQIQDEMITNIHDVMKVGKKIEGARVISIDLKKCEVGLSLRAPRPKRCDFNTLEIGDELEGKVESVVPYGVFVNVGTKMNALLHISRITGGAIENIRQHLNEGDLVKVHIIDIDRQKKTLAVSMLDKKADTYLDRRMSQRLKRYYGSTHPDRSLAIQEKEDKSNELDYFDQAIRELEEALQGRAS